MEMKKSTIWIIVAVCIVCVCAAVLPPAIRYVIKDYEDNERREQEEMQKQLEIAEKTVPQLVDNGETFKVNGVLFSMINVKGGTFTMGNQNFPRSWIMLTDDGYDHRLHPYYAQEVTLSDYSIGQTEVTCELWKAVMGDLPIKEITVGSQTQIDRRNKEIEETFPPKTPITRFSYDELNEFIDKLNQITGKKFRITTEAEWEYAARGGSKSQGYLFSGSNIVDEVAWNMDNTKEQRPQPVMKLKPNELGIYDMSGNVAELCQDRFNFKRNVTQPKVVKLPPATNPLYKKQSLFGRDELDQKRYSKNEYMLFVQKGGSFKTRFYVTSDGSYSGIFLCPCHRDYCFFMEYLTDWVVRLADMECIGFRLALSNEQNNNNQSSISPQSETNERPNNAVQSNVPGDYPDASNRILTPTELSGFSKQELKLMRNEIFARHGYIFKSGEMKNHFASKPWYKPQYNDVNNMLSDIEKQNINTIQQLEK